jgi:hypothetical protein
MSLFERLFAEADALEPKRSPLKISQKFELTRGGTGGPLEPKPVTAKMIAPVSARPVAQGKEGQVFGTKPSGKFKKKFAESLRARFEKLFAEADVAPADVAAKPATDPKLVKPVAPVAPTAPTTPGAPKPVKPDPEKNETPEAPPKPTTGPYKMGIQNTKTIAKSQYTEVLSFIDTVLAETKKRDFRS